jgi:hypothetical protein
LRSLIINDSIDALSPEQAQAALLAFYERLPEDAWSSSKPADVEMQGMADFLRKKAPPDVQAVLGSVMTSKDQQLRGAIAKIVLHQLDSIEPFQQYLREAVVEAGKPKMVALPVAMGATLVVIAVLPKVARSNDGKWSIEFDPSGNLKQLIDSLTAFVHELPKKISLTDITG